MRKDNLLQQMAERQQEDTSSTFMYHLCVVLFRVWGYSELQRCARKDCKGGI